MHFFEALNLLLITIGVISFLTRGALSLRILAIIGAVILFILLIISLYLGADYSFVFGNFNAKIGIEHSLSGVSPILLPFVIFIGIYTVLQFAFLKFHQRLQFSILFSFVGISSVITLLLTKDIFNFYVFFELFSICVYLIFSNTSVLQDKKNALEYLLIGGISSTLVVLAIAIIYVIMGSLNINEIFIQSREIIETKKILLKIAIVFLVLASFIKLGVFPFTSWVKKIYTTCPNYFLPFYGAVFNSIVLCMLCFFLYGALHKYDLVSFVSKIITPFCIAGIIIFSVSALKERDLRVLMGYSTLAQIGYIYICVTTLNVNAVMGGILHILNNTLVKFGMFMFVVQVCSESKTYSIQAMSGVGKNIIMGICFCILSASLVGIPLTSGFISKFYMLQGLIEERRFTVVSVFILGAILNVIYIWKVISLMYFTKQTYTVKFTKLGIFFIVATTMLVLLFGTMPKFTLEKSQAVAISFLQSI